MKSKFIKIKQKIAGSAAVNMSHYILDKIESTFLAALFILFMRILTRAKTQRATTTARGGSGCGRLKGEPRMSPLKGNKTNIKLVQLQNENPLRIRTNIQ